MKTIFQNIAAFLVNSNLWIALGSIAWIQQTRLLTQPAEHNYAVDVLAFSSTFIIYNFHRFITKPDKNVETLSGMHSWMSSNERLLKVLIGLSVVAVLFSLFFLNLQSIILLMALGTVSVFYGIPIPFTNKFRLRDIGVLKPVFVAFVWALVCVVLPVISIGKINSECLLLAGHCFLFFVAITIPFDIRDLKFDKQNLKYPTIPMMFGINLTKRISFIILLLSAIVLWRTVSDFGFAIIAWYAVTAFLIYNTKENSNEYHYTFWLDGTIIAGYVLLLLNNSFKIFSQHF